MQTRNIVFLLSFNLIPGCVCQRAPDFSGVDQVAKKRQLNRVEIEKDLRFMTDAPHPMGSARQAEIAAYIEARAKENAAEVWRQPFTVEVPKRLDGDAGPRTVTEVKSGVNILARFGLVEEPECLILFGSHYDTKIIPGTDYVGANDSASTSALLLDFLRQLKGKTDLKLKCDLVAVWFDGEESILDGWGDGYRHPAGIQDNTYGSRYLASKLEACVYDSLPTNCLPKDLGHGPVLALILLDMLGSPRFKLTLDSNSSAGLVRILQETLARHGLGDLLDPYEKSIEDDHIPFLRRGIPSINLINFENLQTWHKAGDVYEALSFDSLQLAGQISLNLALVVAQHPKGLDGKADKD